MNFLIGLLKVLFLLAMLLLMALPFILEYLTFRKDKENKISYKRFRVVLYCLVYFVVMTVALYLLKEFFLWLQGTSFVLWLSNRIAVSNYVAYLAKLLVMILVNAGIGFLYLLISKVVRIGLKKVDLTKGKKKDGTFTWFQKLERKVIRFFHKEIWFFVGDLSKWMGIVLGSAYLLIFALYLLPALFTASWIPYGFIDMLFSAGYLYPALSVMVLFQIWFFLGGLSRLEEECPELLYPEEMKAEAPAVDLEAIDREVKKQFGDFYACDVDLSKLAQEEITENDHHILTKFIAEAVQSDRRNPQNPKEVYLDCLDQIVGSNESMLINGNFFSEFSMYFLRYLSAVIARGDNVVFVCNDDAQIAQVYDYLHTGLAEISSLFCQGFHQDGVDYDDPIWRLVKISGEKDSLDDATISDQNVLVTSLSYLCSARFSNEQAKFVSQIDTVVFVDTQNTVNKFNRQLALLNTRLKHITRNNALAVRNSTGSEAFRMRYASRQVRYLCFADSRTPGLDKVLKNMLGVPFSSADAMRYNPKTLVRCYRFEGTPDSSGRSKCPQYFTSEEEVGAVMNMAVLCLAKGASSVTVFADGLLPYESLAETIASNMGQVTVKVDGTKIRLNQHFYNPDNYNVVIAVDSGDDLPAALRKYLSLVSDKPSLVILFSRPYLLRDYYLSNIDALWNLSQIERIPVEEGSARDVAQKILVRANAGGISRQEVLDLAANVKPFDAFAAAGDVNGILTCVLEVFGENRNDRLDLYNYFEYTACHDFDMNGKFCSGDRITLRRKGELFEKVNGRDMVQMALGETRINLPVPKSRLSQNFIAGQNLLYQGKVYVIQRVDTEAGVLYARLAVGGKNNESYRYVQDREYRVEATQEAMELLDPVKHVILDLQGQNVSVKDAYVSLLRTPMEVITRGYYPVDPRTLWENCATAYHCISDPGNDELAKQTYRRYGVVSQPTYTTENVLRTTQLRAFENPARMLSIRLCGNFGPEPDKTALLAAVLLGEQLKAMYPSVADSVVVCPLLKAPMDQKAYGHILRRQPKISFLGENALAGDGADLQLLIIEDCPSDLGVASILMNAGDNILQVLFEPVNRYLQWFAQAENKSPYLNFGAEALPECFDFAALGELAKLLGDSGHDLHFVELDTLVQRDTCDFCGRRYPKGQEVQTLEDGRKMCSACASNLVGKNKKALNTYLARAKAYLETTYGIELTEEYEICFESTVKIANTLKQNWNLSGRGSDLPLKSYIDEQKKVHVEYDIPGVNLSELLVRQLTHIWQLQNLPDLAEDLAEGHIALVGIQYLRHLSQDGLATSRASYYESSNSTSGEGYRKLARLLLDNPQFNNNPFAYLLSVTGGIAGSVRTPQPVAISEGDYGVRYTAQTSDRSADGNVPYFYRDRMPEAWRADYDSILEGVLKHKPQVNITIQDNDVQSKLLHAIIYDHPEIFWYVGFSFQGNVYEPNYCATADEVAAVQPAIDEAAAAYLEGIDDTMSAYDVALRLHLKMVSKVDYDTVELNKEKAAGGPDREEIDRLRTLCGVLLDRRAVCEGYARTMQYLLNKCGIEAATAAGIALGEGGHAWNILKLDGEYYYLDTTWDDASDTIQTVKNPRPNLSYFNITTEELLRTRDLTGCPLDMPPCTATRCNYYYVNDLMLESYDLKRIKQIAQKAAKAGGTFFTFKCKNKRVFDQAVNNLLNKPEDAFEIMKLVAKANKKFRADSFIPRAKPEMLTVTIYFQEK